MMFVFNISVPYFSTSTLHMFYIIYLFSSMTSNRLRDVELPRNSWQASWLNSNLKQDLSCPDISHCTTCTSYSYSYKEGKVLSRAALQCPRNSVIMVFKNAYQHSHTTRVIIGIEVKWKSNFMALVSHTWRLHILLIEQKVWVTVWVTPAGVIRGSGVARGGQATGAVVLAANVLGVENFKSKRKLL